ncbi:hypothetical protein ACFQL5_16245 [Aquipuribacter hungaricus]
MAVDGRGGAGKSTLVEQLHALVPASAVVHTDDVAWHDAFFDWADLLADGVLHPLRRGEAVSFRLPAWAQHDRPGAVHVPAGLDTVRVEGTSWPDAQPLLHRRETRREGTPLGIRPHRSSKKDDDRAASEEQQEHR